MRHEYWNRQTLDSEFSVFLFTVLGSECWGVPVEERHPNIELTLQRTRSLCRHIWSQNEYCTSPWLLQSVCQCPYTFTTPKTFAMFYAWLETLTGNMNQKTALCDRLSWSLGILLEANPHNKDTPGMFSWVCMQGSDPVSGFCSFALQNLES